VADSPGAVDLSHPIAQVGGASQALVLDGRYGYMGIGMRIAVLDVADLSHPSVRALGPVLNGIVFDVAVADGLVFAAIERGGLAILEPGDGDHLRLLASLAMPDAVFGVAARGSRVFLGTLHGEFGATPPPTSGVAVVDVADPHRPRVISHTVLGTAPFRRSDAGPMPMPLQIEGDRLFVADASDRLAIFDLSDPERPSLLTTFVAKVNSHVGGPTNIVDMVVHNRRAFLVLNRLPATDAFKREFSANSDSYLSVLDVSESEQLKELVQRPIGGYSYSVATDGEWIVTKSFRNVSVYDAARPEGPALTGMNLGAATCCFEDSGLAVREQRVLFTRLEGGLASVDFRDPARPILSNGTEVLSRPLVLARHEHTLFAISRDGGLVVMDIAQPRSPRTIAFRPAVRAQAATATQDALYLGDGRLLSPWDVSRLEDLKTAASHLSEFYLESMAIQGELLWVGGNTEADGRVAVFDIADPLVPRVLHNFPVSGHILGLSVSGGYLVLAIRGPVADGFLEIFDIADIHRSVSVARLSVAGTPNGLAVQGSHAFVAAAPGLIVVDMSNPRSPVLRGIFTTVYEPLGVAVTGTTAQVLDRSTRYVVDVTNPAHPRQLARHTLPARGVDDVRASYRDHYAVGMVAHDDVLWVAGGMAGLLAYPLAGPVEVVPGALLQR
jgi:hypothetical protein